MSLFRIVYSSRPFGFDQATLDGILLDARRCNARDRVTGALICRQDIYLQLLEGQTSRVEETFRRIRGDDRHVEVILRLSEAAPARLFAAWDMLHDPAHSLIWSAKDIAAGVLETCSADDYREVFTSLSERVAAHPPS